MNKDQPPLDDDALDTIYIFFDLYLMRGEFAFLDWILYKVYLRILEDEICIDEALTYLTVSLPAKDKLPSRAHVFAAMKDKYKEKGLFDGLE